MRPLKKLRQPRVVTALNLRVGAIRDALNDARCRCTEVYWEGTSEDGKGTGVYRRQKRADNTAGSNVYIIALP